MSLKHTLYMTPLNKYRVYGKFPWQLTISILLAALTSLQVILIVTSSTNYSYNQVMLWNDIFLNRNVQGSDTTLTNSYNLFDLIDLQQYIQETVKVRLIQRYNNINKYTFDKYEHIDKINGQPAVRMYINYIDLDKANVIKM